MKTLNLVSSDTLIEREQSPIIKTRRNYHTTKGPKEDGYKKMNKVPDKELIQALADRMKSRKDEYETKHSAHMMHRSRVPSIGSHIKIQTDMNRLNLKTREDKVSKKSLLQPRITDRFDVSVDLSPHGGNSGFSMV